MAQRELLYIQQVEGLISSVPAAQRPFVVSPILPNLELLGDYYAIYHPDAFK